jgi:hypothetical protein
MILSNSDGNLPQLIGEEIIQKLKSSTYSALPFLRSQAHTRARAQEKGEENKIDREVVYTQLNQDAA